MATTVAPNHNNINATHATNKQCNNHTNNAIKALRKYSMHVITSLTINERSRKEGPPKEGALNYLFHVEKAVDLIGFGYFKCLHLQISK